MRRFSLFLPLAAVALTGCDGLRSALTAHTAVAAEAASQELTTERLAELIGNSGIPLQPEVADNKPLAQAIADVWVNYQLMGHAAARGDSLNSPAKLDAALWQQINQIKISKFAEEVSRSWSTPDTAITEAEYNQGELLSAAHILFMFPPGGSPAQMDSVKAEAERVRRQVTAANFAEMARIHSKDPGSADRGGLYTAFPRGYMAKEFEDAVLALRPGEMSGLVQTMYGYHIIRRPVFDEVRGEHGRAKGASGIRTAESTFVAKIEKDGNISVKSNAAAVVKKIAEDVEGNRNNNTVLATSRAGRFTAADLTRLIRTFPQRGQIIQQLTSMPDSVVPQVITDLVRTELIIRLADSAGVKPDSNELANVRSALTEVLLDAWRQLGVEPGSLGAESEPLAGRARLAATRVDAYVDGMMLQTRDYIDVPEPLESLLRSSYPNKISEAGLLRALEQATKVRARLDSARAREGGMQSQIPMGDPSMMPPPPPTQGGGGGGGGF